MSYHPELFEHINHSIYLARGGGGGSSSSGGGHSSSSSSSHSSSSHSSSSSSSGGSDGPWWLGLVMFGGIFGFTILIIWLVNKVGKGKGLVTTVPDGYIDPMKDSQATDQQKQFIRDANVVFRKFQTAWSDFDLVKMKMVTSPTYYKKMVLELNVLKNYERKNQMSNVRILGAYLQKTDDYTKEFKVFFQAQAIDKLIDTRTKSTIFTDTSSFGEFWTFTKVGKSYVLHQIDQTTTEASKLDPGIQAFANKQSFYYDPDFGWLMMPSRGAIFSSQGFGNADINNHVIGYYQDKIVEFYSYEPKAGAGMQSITIAQAILPKTYDDILVTEKSWYNFKPKLEGLNRIETESVDFNKKFAVWAADPDQATSFELLATNFMEQIYKLEFEINIEVVDNVLYLYSPSKDIKYQDMLDVLTKAFDEMKL